MQDNITDLDKVLLTPSQIEVEGWKDSVQLAADSGSPSEDTDRLMRLSRVVGWLDASDPSNLRVSIGSLHDHEGELSVFWKTEPTPESFELVRRAWDHECEYQVVHYFNDEVVHEQQ